MNKISLYLRHPIKNISIVPCQLQVRLKSNKDDKDDLPEEIPEKKVKNKAALEKLNLLLAQIVKEDTVTPTSTLKLARPKPKRIAQQKELKQLKTETIEKKTVENVVISSVKDVAESLGGNIKQTESELLSKLLNSVDAKTDTKPSSLSLSDIFKDMKIDRSKKPDETLSRAQQIRRILHAAKGEQVSQVQTPKSTRPPRDPNQFQRREREEIKLFGKETLNIFSDVTQYADTEMNKTWKRLYDRDLTLAVTHPPSNYFQEMILWTEQGKLWKFPIDNEQGLEEEHNVYFADHVFLEKHLEPWCPSKGPIRHFMELVCVGLSKNPYMTVKKKQEHIAWYRDYFADKQKVLTEVGAIPPNFEIKKKEIEAGEDSHK